MKDRKVAVGDKKESGDASKIRYSDYTKQGKRGWEGENANEKFEPLHIGVSRGCPRDDEGRAGKGGIGDRGNQSSRQKVFDRGKTYAAGEKK